MSATGLGPDLGAADVYRGFIDAVNRQNLEEAARFVDAARYRENCVGFTHGFVDWQEAQKSVRQVWKGLPDLRVELDQVLAIERVSFVTPWTRAAFCYEIEQNKVARCTVMHAGERVVGYVCLWEIGHEIHITNLAVHPEWRRRGVGKRLLALAMADPANDDGLLGD